jgi:hypothetical protein
MGADDVLDIDPPVQELVDLDVEVRVGAADLVAIIGLGKEPRGSQDHAGQRVIAPDQLAQVLGGGLRGAVDVPRDRSDVLGYPGRGLPFLGHEGPAERAGGAREDEPADVRSHALLEQVERAGDVRVHELGALVGPDVGLVQGRRVHDPVDAGEAVFDAGTVDDRADGGREGRAEYVQADDVMPLRLQCADERFAEMSGAAGDENPHACRHIRPR